MDTGNLAVFLIFGMPVIGLVVIRLTREYHSWSLKSRELKLREQQAALEAKQREDELNAKILRMDDYGISPADVSMLAEEVRQLREEVARLKRDSNNQIIG